MSGRSKPSGIVEDVLESHQVDELNTEIQKLRVQQEGLLRKLAKEKDRKADLIAATYEAAEAAVSSMSLSPTPKPKLTKDSKGEEVAVVVLSDFQLGKKTKSYNSDVAAERVARMARKTVELTDIQRRHHPVLGIA